MRLRAAQNKLKVEHSIIDGVREALERLPERRYVDVQTVTLVDEGVRIDAPLDNPYGPQPVGRWPLFVGRDAQVEQIVAQLGSRSGAGHILVHGPKRIGKSSLLEHLARDVRYGVRSLARLDMQSLPTEELRFDRLLGRIADRLAHQLRPRAHAAPPDAAALARDPIRAFGRFLQELHAPGDSERFVVLLDELGVAASRLSGTGQEREFFDMWRALLNDESVYTRLAFVAALPDYSLERLLAAAPGEVNRPPLRIGELGTSIRLSVLYESDARDLIAAPIKAHLEYTPGDLALLLAETGGHPYYIHLVCGQIVTAVQVQQRKTGLRFHERQVIPSDIVAGALETVFANEDAFHHILADSTPGTGGVLRALAALAGPGERTVRRADVRDWLLHTSPSAGAHAITWALEERPDLLVGAGDRIGIRVALVARWLRRHT